jgi:hypothetical protein
MPFPLSPEPQCEVSDRPEREHYIQRRSQQGQGKTGREQTFNHLFLNMFYLQSVFRWSSLYRNLLFGYPVGASYASRALDTTSALPALPASALPG